MTASSHTIPVTRSAAPVMPERRPSPIESGREAAVFATTHWSLVLRAGREPSPESEEALETLCRTYWPPLYVFVRRKGHGVHEAQDLVQDFLARILERRDLDTVHPNKGRFRSFLLASLNHYLANEWHRGQRLKRGGRHLHLSLEELLAEGVAEFETSNGITPERAFERRWAETVIARALERLKGEWQQRYQPKHFDDLKVFLLEARGTAPFAEVARRLGLTEPALKSIVHRLRKRFRELFREEIARTVQNPSEVEEEIRHLFHVLGD